MVAGSKRTRTEEEFNMSKDFDIDAEKAVLGSVLVFGTQNAFDLIEELSGNLFYDQRHRVIFDAMCALAKEGVKPDYITIKDKLEKMGAVSRSGGVAYIASLPDFAAPALATARSLEGILNDCFLRRSMKASAARIAAMADDETKDPKKLLSEAQGEYSNLLEMGRKIWTMQELIPGALEEIDRMCKNKGISGILSGYAHLDGILNGFHEGEFIIVAARPSIGKTAFSLSVICNLIKQGVPCGLLSLEMNRTSILQRMISQQANIPLTKIRGGMLTVANFKTLEEVASSDWDKKFFLSDKPNMELVELCSSARQMQRQGAKIIFIDYIGLIETSEGEKVYEKQGYISKELKGLARKLGIPVVVTCQVGRSAEGKEPNLAELRGSGSIEQDADVVMFIHSDRAGWQNGGGNYQAVQDRKITVAKQRNGAIGSFFMDFYSPIGRFEDRKGS